MEFLLLSLWVLFLLYLLPYLVGENKMLSGIMGTLVLIFLAIFGIYVLGFSRDVSNILSDSYHFWASFKGYILFDIVLSNAFIFAAFIIFIISNIPTIIGDDYTDVIIYFILYYIWFLVITTLFFSIMYSEGYLRFN